MSDVGDQNVTQTKRLYRTLAAWDDLINLVNFTLEERERSHVVCCFQLPQVVRFASKWHRLPASRDNPSIYAELMCCPASLIFTEDGSPSVQFAREGDDGYVFSQMIALFPLWGNSKMITPLIPTAFHPREISFSVLLSRKSTVYNYPNGSRATW